MRSGWIDIYYGISEGAGGYGRVWSSISRSGIALAYVLDFVSSGINPSGNGGRYHAFPVRCRLCGVCSGNDMCPYFQQNVPICVREAKKVSLKRLECGRLRRGNTIVKPSIASLAHSKQKPIDMIPQNPSVKSLTKQG